MSITNVVRSIVFFFVQPVFIIGLLYAIYNHRKRVNYTRQTFRMNFNKRNFELQEYLTKGILPGLIVSALALGIGIPLTIEWYFVYQIITIFILLIGGSRFIQPVFTFSLSALVLYGLNEFNISSPMEWIQAVLPGDYIHVSNTFNDSPELFMNLVLIAVLVLFISTFFMNKEREEKLYPVIRPSKRGKNIALYLSNSLWAVPLLVLVPGEMIESTISWWPLLYINGNEYAILFLPLLVGFHYTLSSQSLKDATMRLQKEFRYLALVGLLLFGVSYFVPLFSRIAVVLLIIGGLFVLIRHRRRENMWTFRYGPADEGLRVIAVREDSPAERLNLSIGDILLEVNDYPLTDTEEYNQILAYNRSYIKVRVRRNDGEIVYAETPLYDDDYNNLGLLLLEK